MSSLQLATTGTVSGLQNNQQANLVFGALATISAGGTAPTTTSTGLASLAGMLWHDTSAGMLKLRDQADTTWMPFAVVDETNKTVIPVDAHKVIVLSATGSLPIGNTTVFAGAGSGTVGINLPRANCLGSAVAVYVDIIRTDSSGHSMSVFTTGGDSLPLAEATAVISVGEAVRFISNGGGAWYMTRATQSN